MPDDVRLAIRRYLNTKLVSEDLINVPLSDAGDDVLKQLSTADAERTVAGEIDMIELEFLDEPDPLQRFVRVGINPDGMVMPLAIDLGDKTHG